MGLFVLGLRGGWAHEEGYLCIRAEREQREQTRLDWTGLD